MDGDDLGENLTARAMLRAEEVAVAHEGQIVALQGIDAVQNVMLRLNLGEDYVTHLQCVGLNERDIIHAAFDERAHAYAGGRKHDLLAFGYEARDLGDKYLVR